MSSCSVRIEPFVSSPWPQSIEPVSPNFHGSAQASLFFPHQGRPLRRESSLRGAEGARGLPRASCTRSLRCGCSGPTGRASGLLQGYVTEWRRTPRHMSPLRRSHSPSPEGRASGQWGPPSQMVELLGGYYGGLAFPRLAVTSVIALHVKEGGFPPYRCCCLGNSIRQTTTGCVNSFRGL